MPNNQDTNVKLLPGGYQLCKPAYPMCEASKNTWVIRGGNNAPFSGSHGYVHNAMADAFAAAMNAPTPREQELEAQNKALSAKVEVTKGVLDEYLEAQAAYEQFDATTSLAEKVVARKRYEAALTLLKTLQDALKR